MKVTVIGMGTRGDAQPAIALGKALKAAGYQVNVLASKGFESWIESHGLEAAPTNMDIQAMMASEGGRDWVESGNNPINELKKMRALMEESVLVMATIMGIPMDFMVAIASLVWGMTPSTADTTRMARSAIWPPRARIWEKAA